MVDQNLLTIFVALTAVAVLIQTGILVGFYFLSAKLSRQADQALDTTHALLGRVNTLAQDLQVVTGRIVEFGSAIRRRAASYGYFLLAIASRAIAMNSSM